MLKSRNTVLFYLGAVAPRRGRHEVHNIGRLHMAIGALLACAIGAVFLGSTVPANAGPLAGQGKCGAGENLTPTEAEAKGLPSRQALASSVVCLINAERTSRGLPALRVNGRLVARAAGHGIAAVRLKWWEKGADSHVNPETGSTIESRLKDPKGKKLCDGKDPNWFSEITYTASGSGATPIGAVNWWMNISTGGHKEAILDPQIQYFGLGTRPDVADRNLPQSSKMGTYVFDFISCP